MHAINKLDFAAAIAIALCGAGAFMLLGWPHLHTPATALMVVSVVIGIVISPAVKADERRLSRGGE